MKTVQDAAKSYLNSEPEFLHAHDDAARAELLKTAHAELRQAGYPQEEIDEIDQQFVDLLYLQETKGMPTGLASPGPGPKA